MIRMDLTEKTIESRSIFDGKVIRVKVDRVQLPGGRESEREIVEHVGAVAIVPVDENNQVYLVRQFRKPLEKMLLEIPAGKLEPGEDPLDCARRELVEEIGYYPRQIRRIAFYYSSPGFCNEEIHLYLATDLVRQEVPGEEGEFLNVLSLPFREALNRIMAQEIDDGKTIAGLLLAAKHLAVDS
ncbi:MAG: NUDIX hydrolase [Bacillota bacterium]